MCSDVMPMHYLVQWTPEATATTVLSDIITNSSRSYNITSLNANTGYEISVLVVDVCGSMTADRLTASTAIGEYRSDSSQHSSINISFSSKVVQFLSNHATDQLNCRTFSPSWQRPLGPNVVQFKLFSCMISQKLGNLSVAGSWLWTRVPSTTLTNVNAPGIISRTNWLKQYKYNI